MSYSRSQSRSGSAFSGRSRSPSARGYRKRNHSPAPRSRGRHYDEGGSHADGKLTPGTGVISSLNERGFGFISPGEEDENSEIYFHCTALGRSYPFDDLREGDEVEYEYVMDHKKNKPRAKSVKFVRSGGRSKRRGRSRSGSRSYERGGRGSGGGRSFGGGRDRRGGGHRSGGRDRSRDR